MLTKQQSKKLATARNLETASKVNGKSTKRNLQLLRSVQKRPTSICKRSSFGSGPLKVSCIVAANDV